MVSVRWIRQIKIRRRQHVYVVATGSATASGPGAVVAVKVKLTRYGRRLFKRRKTLRLTQSVGFKTSANPTLYGALAGPFYVRR